MERGETIAAIATGMTDSGIGIIRISGDRALEVGDRLFRPARGKKALREGKSHRMYYGYAVEAEEDFVIDEVMAVAMKAPRSYTGEDTVEIQCHGGVLVMRKILEASLKCGARMAQPGEFTKRAFLNGRIDLSRAEAVMDVIRSQNDYALASSVSQLRGSLAEKVNFLRENIIYEIAFIESALDDPEHISLEGYGERLGKKLEGLLETARKLIDSAENGRLMSQGIQTVILGKPNVGKSSLLNCLVGEERAIVTEVAGTTRDILRETVRLGNISLNVADTAGIHETEDKVEKIGVERALEYADNADLLVYVVDASAALDENDREIASMIQNRQNRKTIVLLNKSDLETVVTQEDLRMMFPDTQGFAIVNTSFKEGSGMDEFRETVEKLFFRGEISGKCEVVITNMRHKEALEEARDSLLLVKRSIEDGMPEDFYSIDLMNAYASLGRITGEEVDDDLVEEIFSKFCMGK